ARKKAEQVAGRLVVRRIPDLNPKQVEQPTLFDTYRHHAFFTTTDKEAMDTVVADKTHRAHAIIEQVHADLKAGPLAHLPSGVFTANSAWLVLAVIAFNLTRTAGVIADRAGRLAKATTATIRRTLIHVPARLARSARRITLHLPKAWPWQNAFTRLFTITHAPPPTAAT
ncbi:MAG: transposase, partial [Microbacterium sp.]|nr:transposase [Microbacterium sp.]